jgi:Tfp pilus assembly protein FimV
MRYLVLMLLLSTSLAWAESTRIEVYPLSQNYWDINNGDTLGEIVDTLIPGNSYLQEKLMRDIVSTNPQAFPGGNPNRMLANKRLWLPNAVKPPKDSTQPSGYTIESFQWGSIKKRDEGRGARDED